MEIFVKNAISGLISISGKEDKFVNYKNLTIAQIFTLNHIIAQISFALIKSLMNPPLLKFLPF